jgi:hypothetical protein
VAAFDKTIPPGGAGKITLKISTRGREGALIKRIRVHTNDPLHRIALLTIKASIKVPISVSSRYAYLTGSADAAQSKTITVNAMLPRPLSLEPIHFSLAQKMSYQIIEQDPGRRFLIKITSIPGPAGQYAGKLKLKTNYPEKPELVFFIRGKFQKTRPHHSTGTEGKNPG